MQQAMNHILTYLTDDEERIAKIQEDPEIEQEFIDAFRQNLVIMGYDPDNADDLKEFYENEKLVKL